MATANNLMSGGLSAGTAAAINGNTALVTAAGTTLADATGISGDAIATAGTGGIRLPLNATVGDKIYFVNVSGATLKIYPGSASVAINAITAGTEISIATQKSCVFMLQSALQWRTIPLVPS